jgi:hypothetical protein
MQLTLDLDRFSRSALERLASRGNGSVSGAVTMASLYYLADRESDRPAWRVPPLADGAGASEMERVEVDEETWRALADEADRQGVTPDTLALHALLYLVADIDRGRVTERLAGAFAERGDSDQ